MKGITWFAVLLIVCILVFLPGNGMGQIREGSVSLNPNVGGYVFQGGQHIEDDLTYGLGLGYNFTENWGVEGNFNYVNTDSNADSSDGENVEAYLYRLDALYHFMPEKKLVPYLAAGVGAIRISGDIDNKGSDPLLNFGAGVKYFFTENLAVRGDIREIITDDTNYNLIYTVGLTYLFGGEKNAAPAPEPAVSQPKAPEPVAPQPKAPEPVAPPPPPPAPEPVTPKPADSDGDGVYDNMDKCPDTPKGVAVNNAGCPLDSDGDGVYDYLDKCPDTPKGIKVDANGCPVPLKEKVSIELNVEFDFDSAKIRTIYNEHIQKVANFLKAYPDAEALIEGHTDSIGDEKYNQKLSEKRAQSVKDYIVSRFNVNPSRLKVKGYGESMPIADNKKKEGRQKNRRVVAVISTVISK
jgi:OOP family OmpA-OmpF porin